MFQRWAELKDSHQPGQGSIINQLNNDAINRSFVVRNREHIKVVTGLVLFCAKQDIPLRRHQENKEQRQLLGIISTDL